MEYPPAPVGGRIISCCRRRRSRPPHRAQDLASQQARRPERSRLVPSASGKANGSPLVVVPRMVPPARSRSPLTASAVRGSTSGGLARRPRWPLRRPTTFQPRPTAASVAARITALRPAQSPPLVRIRGWQCSWRSGEIDVRTSGQCRYLCISCQRACSSRVNASMIAR